MERAMAIPDTRAAQAPPIGPALSAVVTRASTRRVPELDSPRGPRRGRRRVQVPARLRIMAWLVLLLFIALLTVVIVTRNILVASAENSVAQEMLREAAEFQQFAASGINPSTGRPYASGWDLLRQHISRQSPDRDEIVLGVTAGGQVIDERAGEGIGSAGPGDRLRQIVDSPLTSGVLQTADGRLLWTKVPVVDQHGQPGGAFIDAYALDLEIREVDVTIRILALVSGIGLLIAAGASWLVSGQILAPVNAVRRTAERIGHEDLTQRIEVSGKDDIAVLAEQFNGMLDRLEQAFSAQRQFLDDASHELRTPITIIRGNLEFVLDDDPHEQAEVVRLCTDELDRMSRIVEELLLIAKSRRPDFVTPLV